MVILVSGGCKNGKTSIAEKILYNMSCGKDMYYIATMVPYDNEDIKRINNHIEERKKYNFNTIEIVNSVDKIIDSNGYYLFDSITAYLLNHIVENKNVIDDNNLKANVNDNINFKSNDLYNKIIDDINKIKDKNIIFISDYIFSDANDYDEFTTYYIKTLAMIEKYVASIADSVIYIDFSNIVYYKGKELIEKYI